MNYDFEAPCLKNKSELKKITQLYFYVKCILNISGAHKSENQGFVIFSMRIQGKLSDPKRKSYGEGAPSLWR